MKIKEVFFKALGIFGIMTVLCGLVYTLVVTGISQGLFKEKANGSIIEVDGIKYGSELLGQKYTDEKHMWGRIVNVDTGTFKDDEGNTLAYASASNKSPAGDELEAEVEKRVQMIKAANPNAEADKIPVELVTCSGSGVDPHISPAAAEYQVPRISEANNMPREDVREIIRKNTKGKFLGVLGEETVNVLKVNLMLDGILKK